MMIAAMARAGRVLDEPRYVAAAVRAARFVLARLRDGEGRLLHAWRGGSARIPAFLDDYAFLIRGLLALSEATGEEALDGPRRAARRRGRAPSGRSRRRLSSWLEDAPDLLVRPKTVNDGAVPSGNAVMLRNLLELAKRTGDDGYRSRAELGLRAFAGSLRAQPVVVVGPRPGVARGPRRGSGGWRASGRRVGRQRRGQRHGASHRVARSVMAGDRSRCAWRSPPAGTSMPTRHRWSFWCRPASAARFVTWATRRVRGCASRLPRRSWPSTPAGSPSPARRRPRPSSVRLTYQACDDDRCLPPVTRELTLAGTRAVIRFDMQTTRGASR